MDELVLERDGRVAVLTLNRPEARNALTRGLMVRLMEAVSSLAEDPEIRCLVLTGAGEKAFCAGLDLRELSSDTSILRSADGGGIALPDPVRALETCPKPVIGAVNGVAVTGGLELALGCDILIASRAARFADTHGRVGVMPGWGLSQKLSRIVGLGRAKEMSFSGNFIAADQALAWGLVNRIVEPHELMGTALQLARDIAEVPPAFVQAYKRLIDEGYALPFGEAVALERERMAAHNRLVTPEEIAGRRAAVQARGRPS